MFFLIIIFIWLKSCYINNYFEVLFIVSSKNGFYGNEIVFIVFDGSEVV